MKLKSLKSGIIIAISTLTLISTISIAKADGMGDLLSHLNPMEQVIPLNKTLSYIDHINDDKKGSNSNTSGGNGGNGGDGGSGFYSPGGKGGNGGHSGSGNGSGNGSNNGSGNKIGNGK
ncbi:hypothetical protein Xvie_02011 [Xenorhabdus vietnamensis]|uniref:Uncharacterized protein n=1 Tax=Xenorhabdus vietnamensis TaxID=351656 RepID=A0A1Y2SE53_9GAMM|nr:hypothetical protein [Xenorhabdus vietnamensis]OTA16241.1 hypothetical protein Xvie_02011 [Xenorhabdus vietnamensis]